MIRRRVIIEAHHAFVNRNATHLCDSHLLFEYVVLPGTGMVQLLSE